MRICVIGKFPPIQGGVSARTYWTAHALAERGHDVHVVTNAKEVGAPFRMYMRDGDWSRCEAAFAAGSVTVHWTAPVDRSQSYIPMASPFVSKLASLVVQLHSSNPIDVIFSHYLEPYGVAAYVAAQMTGVPHVVRMAGSDAGRLWRHPQLEPLYDQVLRSAHAVVAAGAVADRAIERGVASGRVASGGSFIVPEHLFVPQGPVLDPVTLHSEAEADPETKGLVWGDFVPDRPYFGMYGKLGETKGSFALLAALHELRRMGLDVGLVALAHGPPAIERRFRACVSRLGLRERILQLPFIPHWRVPEFLRGCLAVCCLEQDFPISFHAPIIPLEVLLCGRCLVASTELLRKLPDYTRLPSGYGCVAIEDVGDIRRMTEALARIVADPTPVQAVGVRGHNFASQLQRGIDYPGRLEDILKAVAARRRLPRSMCRRATSLGGRAQSRFRLTHLASAALAQGRLRRIGRSGQSLKVADNVVVTRKVLAAIEQASAEGGVNLDGLRRAVHIEVAIAAAEDAPVRRDNSANPRPLFRLQTRRWALDQDDFPRMCPVRNPQLQVIAFDYDVSKFRNARSARDFPNPPNSGSSFIVAFARHSDEYREPLLIDELTARILELSDGTRTTREIAEAVAGTPSAVNEKLSWIENVFVCDLIGLRESPVPYK